jgi:hypothetical protein
MSKDKLRALHLHHLQGGPESLRIMVDGNERAKHKIELVNELQQWQIQKKVAAAATLDAGADSQTTPMEDGDDAADEKQADDEDAQVVEIPPLSILDPDESAWNHIATLFDEQTLKGTAPKPAALLSVAFTLGVLHKNASGGAQTKANLESLITRGPTSTVANWDNFLTEIEAEIKNDNIAHALHTGFHHWHAEQRDTEDSAVLKQLERLDKSMEKQLLENGTKWGIALTAGLTEADPEAEAQMKRWWKEASEHVDSAHAEHKKLIMCLDTITLLQKVANSATTRGKVEFNASETVTQLVKSGKANADEVGCREQIIETEIPSKPLAAALSALDQSCVRMKLTSSKLMKILLNKKANGPDLLVVPCKHNNKRAATEYLLYARRYCKKGRRTSSAGTKVREPFAKSRNELDGLYEDVVKHYVEDGSEITYELTKLRFLDVVDAYDSKLSLYRWKEKDHPELTQLKGTKSTDTLLLDINSLKSTLPDQINHALMLWRDPEETDLWLQNIQSKATKSFTVKPEDIEMLSNATPWTHTSNPPGSPPIDIGKLSLGKRPPPPTPAKPANLEEQMNQEGEKMQDDDELPPDLQDNSDSEVEGGSDSDSDSDDDSCDESEDETEPADITPKHDGKRPRTGAKNKVRTTQNATDWYKDQEQNPKGPRTRNSQ